MYRHDYTQTIFTIIVIILVSFPTAYCGIRQAKLEGQCSRECAPQDSNLTSYWDGWHCVCVDKGVQLGRREAK